MTSVLELLGDQLYLITVVFFAAASFAIIRRSRRSQSPSGGAPLAGLRTAVVASAVSAALFLVVVLTIAWIFRALTSPGYYYGDSPAPSTPPVDPATQLFGALYLLLWLTAVPAVAFLAVLDLYALVPPRPPGPARVVKSYGAFGVIFSAFLLGVTLYIPVLVDDANASAAERDARAASDQLALDVEARSAGLSIDVTVVDVGFGAATENGRFVEHLTLDIRLRSATEIELRLSEDGFGSNLLQLYPAYAPDAGYTPPMYLEWKQLPPEIPAGFAGTYRLDVPVTGTFPADHGQPDPVTSGQWEAQLVLFDRAPEPARITSVGPVEPYYQTDTTFDVSAP